jgi:hypothetical protein
MSWATEHDPAGCSKRLSSKAAGESKPEAYPQGYVEDFDEPRTMLAGFFSVLLRSWWGLVRQERHVFLFKGEMDDQENDPHADRGISDIEGWPMVGVHIDIEKVDHLAIS